MIAFPAESRERLVTYGPSTKPRPGNQATRGMLGSSPHQRPGTEPPGTNVASGERFARDEIAVMNRRLVPRHTLVWNHWRVPSDARGIKMRNVASVVSGRMSNSAPGVVGVYPGHTPAGGFGVFSEKSVTCVPAGGLPALTVYCTPSWVALVLHAAPVQVVVASGVPPHGRTSMEIAAGGVTLAVP